MTFIITMSNPGGELDGRTARDGREVAEVLASMVTPCSAPARGDGFTPFGEEDADA